MKSSHQLAAPDQVLGAQSELVIAQTLHWAGQSPAALQHAARALLLGDQLPSHEIRYQALLHQAWLYAESGRSCEGLESLGLAFSLGRERGYAQLHFYVNNEHVLARLCGWALQKGVEVEYARQVIRERKLVPRFAAAVPDSWPLPLKIYTLGGFSLLRDDEPVRFTGKAKTKPLELLKALVAFGGREVRKHQLAEALWPEADADLAMYSLTSALHRLRAIVGTEAIKLDAGCLSLCPRHCWVDLWSFERELTALEQALSGPHSAEAACITARVVQQYRGAFLERDAELPWALATRERLQARVVRALDTAGSLQARAGRHDEALCCLQKAVDIDPLAEGPYRSLMQLNLDRGRHADVLLTYQRCRRSLASGLGCAPSLETEALVRKVRVA